jgi:hypothetical protein
VVIELKKLASSIPQGLSAEQVKEYHGKVTAELSKLRNTRPS